MTFEQSEVPEDSPRDTCKAWCEAQANNFEANCCTLALFGTESGEQYQAYCALYKIEESQVYMPSSDEGSGINAFYTSNLMKDVELVNDADIAEFVDP